MPIATLKRLLPRICIPAAVAAAGVVFLAYPRRQVPSMLRLVPREGLAVCVRARGLGQIWRRCARSEFGRMVARGEIFPLDELRAADEEFREEWEDLDTSQWPEIAGRDCVLVLYAGGAGTPPRAALWARVGFKARLLHLWERGRAAVCFWRAGRIQTRRVGTLTVNSVLDRKRGTVDASYVLAGDLGIATTGDGERFWERVAALAQGGGAPARGAEGVIAEVRAPGRGKAQGAFFADAAALRQLAGARIDKSGRVVCEEGGAFSARAAAREALAGWTTMSGSFTLGERTTLEARIGRPGGGSAKPLSADPLLPAAARGGILYAAGRWNPRDLLDRARRSWDGGEVRFEKKGGAATFPAAHFSMRWLGDDWSLLLYLDGRGMLHAAASAAVGDRTLARARLRRFLELADGAELFLADGRGGGWAPVSGALEVEEEKADRGLRWRLSPGAPLEYLYAPVVLLRDGRLVVATADPPGLGAAVPLSANAGGTGRFLLRGGEMERAAASLRQILAIAGAFVEKEADRERIDGARRALGALAWLAPLREVRATASDEKGGTRLSVIAEIGDIRGR